jgi:hypothetical protein
LEDLFISGFLEIVVPYKTKSTKNDSQKKKIIDWNMNLFIYRVQKILCCRFLLNLVFLIEKRPKRLSRDTEELKMFLSCFELTDIMK